MNKRLSTWLIILIIIAAGGILIWIENPLIHLRNNETKLFASLALAAICIVILLFDDLIIRLWQWLVTLTFFERLKELTGKRRHQPDVSTEETQKYSAKIKAIRLLLRQRNRRNKLRYVRILLLTGNIPDVEKLAPGLTSHLWREDQGTIVIWGGDPAQPVDRAWIDALRRLRRRPVDGIVWVTSALDGNHSSPLTEDTLDAVSDAIHVRYELLGWRLPLYVWSLQQSSNEAGRITQPVGCLLPAGRHTHTLNTQLQALIPDLVTQGIQQICGAPQHHFLLSLAERLTNSLREITEPLTTLLNPYRPLPLAGVIFSPATPGSTGNVKQNWRMDNRWHVLPESVRALPAGLRPQKPGFGCGKALALGAATLMVLWGAGMVVSFCGNRALITDAQEQVQQVQGSKQSLSTRLMALAELQKTLSRLQYREAHGAPWYLYAGMNQDSALLAALTPRYAESALPLLRDAAARHLQQQLEAFVELPPESVQRSRMAKGAYDQLKVYLMLVNPQRMEPEWFSRTLMLTWPQREGVPAGFWQANGPSMLSFYGAQFIANPQWRWGADDALISQSRTLLVRQMGMRNSESTLYQKVLAQVANQFADMRLTDMTGDTDAARLFMTDETVPGIFTRQAWEEAVQSAINTVAKGRREELDWVLTEGSRTSQQQDTPEVIKERLTARYFADFSGAWLNFLNSLRLRKAQTLSDAIDQLTLMADVRQSPLVALMNTLHVQGRTGQVGGAISDSLVKSAQNLLSRDKLPAIDQTAVAFGPLDATFGPILALMDNQASGNESLTLQTFLTRVTQVRLRLQQVTNASDPQAMTQTLAQTVFQGKAVDLTATRDYGSLMAAGLGQEWSGFGQTVFVRPMEQAWQQVLNPAADSLNAQWRAAVVNDWNSAFAGRYPFKNVSSDASLPLLAKYLNTDAGRITRFLQTRLNGVLHREGNRWVPDSINAQGLTFNPAFLQAINTLSQIADVVFTNGEAGLHFDLRPGTAEEVMQTNLVIDSQKLFYVNQMPVWKRFTWPADTEAPGASLSWISSQAGTRLYADLPGSWGLIRLLDSAKREAYAGTGSSWNLSWKAQDGRMLNYTLRTEAGEGPLALLKLRNFTLPNTIFSVNTAPQQVAENAEILDSPDNTDETD